MFVPHKRPSVSQPEASNTNLFQWPAGARRWPSHAGSRVCAGEAPSKNARHQHESMRVCKRAAGGVSPKPYLTVKPLTHTHSSQEPRRWRMQPSDFVLPSIRKRRQAGPGDAPPLRPRPWFALLHGTTDRRGRAAVPAHTSASRCAGPDADENTFN
jgi:hypothetical protein